MFARVHASRHFAVGQAIAGDFSFVQFQSHGLFAIVCVQQGLVNHTRRAFAELVLQLQFLPSNVLHGCVGHRSGFQVFAERIACERQPCQAWHMEQPVWKFGQLIRGNTNKF